MASTQIMFLVISTPCLTIPVSRDDSGSSESPSDSVSLPYRHNIFFSNMFPPSHWAFFPQIIFAPTVVFPHRLSLPAHARSTRTIAYIVIAAAVYVTTATVPSIFRERPPSPMYLDGRFPTAKLCCQRQVMSFLRAQQRNVRVSSRATCFLRVSRLWSTGYCGPTFYFPLSSVISTSNCINAVSCTRTLSTSGCRSCSICSSLIRPPTSQGLR
ncbi:hypothetical protein B0H14DRAFT_2790396 [Mycena olivaceomarginata]|nr:hypothetical protein B0H14DRAFT_2998399 [Mycena olivaceomarginata]KAJ7837876.1 hypothetical protein B0H14DRAFT_2790396 [Mycena olivaceomarginata]